jgi:hypothetical protein
MYNKLFTKILDSSIWLENHATVRVWITLLASMDEQFKTTLTPARHQNGFEDFSTGGFTLRSYASVADSVLLPIPSDAVYPSGLIDGIPLCNYPGRIDRVRHERRAIYGSSYLHTASNKKCDRDQRYPKSVERRLVQKLCVRDRWLDPTSATSHATMGRRNISGRYKELPRNAEANDSHYGTSILRLGNR